jgi:hypothetical protein
VELRRTKTMMKPEGEIDDSVENARWEPLR